MRILLLFVAVMLTACTPGLLPHRFAIHLHSDGTSSAVVRTYADDWAFNGDELTSAQRSYRIVGQRQNDTCIDTFNVTSRTWVNTAWVSSMGAPVTPCFPDDTLTVTRSYVENAIRNGTFAPAATKDCRRHSCYTIITEG